MHEPHRSPAPPAEEARSFPPQDEFPAVLANSRIIGLMELTAERLMRPHLARGEASLGIEMNVRFHAAVTSEAMVRAQARHAGASGRLHHIIVQAFDECGLIASCEHTRAVVLPSRLLAQARRRAGLPAMLLEV